MLINDHFQNYKVYQIPKAQLIIADLENEGYEVLPFLLPACGVNAPHKRERIWIVAYSEKSRKRRLSIQQRGQNEAKDIDAYGENESGITSNTRLFRPQRAGQQIAYGGFTDWILSNSKIKGKYIKLT